MAIKFVNKPKKTKAPKAKVSKPKKVEAASKDVHVVTSMAQAVKFVGVAPTAKVTVSMADGSMQEFAVPVHEESKKQEPQQAPVCTVGFQAGQTFNLGNFNSAKVSILLNMPCQPGEIDPTYEFIKTWVNEKMLQLQTEVKGDSPNINVAELSDLNVAKIAKTKAA